MKLNQIKDAILLTLFLNIYISQNLVANGDFRNYPLAGRSWGIFNNLDGWKLSENVEFGNKNNYNSNWPSDVNTVMELDTNRNQTIS